MATLSFGDITGFKIVLSVCLYNGMHLLIMMFVTPIICHILVYFIKVFYLLLLGAYDSITLTGRILFLVYLM